MSRITSFRNASLDADAFGEVARLVGVGAFADRGVVGKKLDRDRLEQGRDKPVAARHRDPIGEAALQPDRRGSSRRGRHWAPARDDAEVDATREDRGAQRKALAGVRRSCGPGRVCNLQYVELD
jgi:hypothetical protein